MVTEQNIQKFSTQCKNIFTQIERDVIGQKEVIEGAVIAMIAGGNVLLELSSWWKTSPPLPWWM